MSTTTKQAIIKEIETRFWNITVANGYFRDIERVCISKLTEYQSRDLPYLNFHVTGDSPAANKYGRNEREMTIIAEFYTKIYDDGNISTIAFELEEDMVIALNRSNDSPLKTDEPNRNLNGLVKFITDQDMTPIISGKNSDYAGVAIEFNINYILDAETLS